MKGEYKVKDANLRPAARPRSARRSATSSAGRSATCAASRTPRPTASSTKRSTRRPARCAPGDPPRLLTWFTTPVSEDAKPVNPIDPGRRHRPRPPEGRRPRPRARLLQRRARLRAHAAVRRRGRVRLRRRLSPPHRAQHLAVEGRARRRRRGPPGSFTPRSATRPGATLADALRRVREAGIPLDGASDHGVSEALYLRDPDENGVELYWDRPRGGVAARPERSGGRRDVHCAARPRRPAGRARRLDSAPCAAVAQLARASACHAEGRGFESHQPLCERTPC